jgi:hypothetical protein
VSGRLQYFQVAKDGRLRYIDGLTQALYFQWTCPPALPFPSLPGPPDRQTAARFGELSLAGAAHHIRAAAWRPAPYNSDAEVTLLAPVSMGLARGRCPPFRQPLNN